MRVSSLVMSGGGVIAALNGALQKRVVLPTETPLVPGNVHRIKEVQLGIGGKGQDVAIALSCLGYSKEKLKIAQFLGTGAEGDQVYEMLEERVGKEAMSLTVRPKSKLRTCTSVVAADTTTELIEPSGEILSSEMSELLSKVEKVEGGTAAAVCIMGTMPPGCPTNSYADIYARSAGPGTLVVIDSVAGLEPLLLAIAKRKGEKGQTIFKVNASELCALAGVEKSNNEVDGINEEELLSAITGFLTKNPVAKEVLKAIAITDGKHPAHLAALSDKEFQLYRIPVASLPKGTLFPIGAGDAVAAGLMASWQCLLEMEGASSSSAPCLPNDLQEALQSQMKRLDISEDSSTLAMLTALSFGNACGSASCLEEENSVLRPKEVLTLFGKAKPAFVSSHGL
mgnify:CR=1 FL=1